MIIPEKFFKKTINYTCEVILFGSPDICYNELIKIELILLIITIRNHKHNVIYFLRLPRPNGKRRKSIYSHRDWGT